MVWRIGVDSGGTFTDVCLFNEKTRELRIWKVSSTPEDPSLGIATAVQEGLDLVGASAPEVSFLGHGTTVATNALIEHRGVDTGLLVTDGFRDLLEIGRQKRPSLYDVFAEKPEIIVPRERRYGVVERLDKEGNVVTPLDEDSARNAARALAKQGVQAVAICFLYGFINSRHEERVREIVAEELGDVFVSVSSQTAPEFREFERLSTTVVNAYLGPIMKRYIERLKNRLRDHGIKVPPQLTQSNGGVIGFDTAAEMPVRTVLSGPSTGVVAAEAISRTAGFDNIITFDVGGTSSDVALLQNGVCQLTSEADVHGYPIKAPMLDIHTVGAGGGSIANVDNGGLLKVGPRSAGADPGPACYGLGNKEPTVTDANIVLQTLNPNKFLGGRMKVRRDFAISAVEAVAKKLNMDVMETAQGIISVVTANMAKAIRVISVQRGHDPRNYALMAFGGAGPLHAARLARELDMKKVIVPLTPGTLCALGLLMTDLRSDFAVSRMVKLEDGSVGPLSDAIVELSEKSLAWFESEGIAPENRSHTHRVDMRYVGQNYELSVELPKGAINAETLSILRKRFEETHKQRFGFTVPDEAIQVVTMRVEAAGFVEKASFTPQEDCGADSSAAIIGTRGVWSPEAAAATSWPVFAREKLRAGNIIHGPAIVEQMDTTTVVLADMVCHVDPYLNLILEFQS